MSRAANAFLSLIEVPGELPPEYRAVPVLPGQESAPLRLCVLLRAGAKGAAALTVLREGLDCRVLLGCVCDAAWRVQRLVELWVQDTDALAGAAEAYREAATNAALDERWAARLASFEGLHRASVIRTGFESAHPAPIFADAQAGALLAPAEDFRLCTDDALLASQGLPGYAASSQRFFIANAKGSSGGGGASGGAVAPANREAGAESPDSVAGALGLPKDAVPVNPGAGLMLVLDHRPAGLEAYVDALSGAATDGLTEDVLRAVARTRASAHGAGAAAGHASSDAGWMLLGEPGAGGRAAETLFLKLRLLADAVGAVRDLTQRTQRPMLNLTGASFRVALAGGYAGPGADVGGGLPFLWTARAQLTDIGEALPLNVPGTRTDYFITAGNRGPSIYAPAGVGAAASGRGTLRLRRVTQESEGTIVEATLATSDRLASGRSDLVWLRFALAGRRVDMHGMIEGVPGRAGGDLRVRSLPTRFDDATGAAVRQAEGVPIPETLYEVVPLLSSPCDLYSLGVLAIRVLIASGGAGLGAALDDLLSLATEAQAAAEELGGTLDERVRVLLTRDERWRTALGPQRLLAPSPANAGGGSGGGSGGASGGSGGSGGATPVEAIPTALWADVLATVMRMFPGQVSEASCRDFGDAPVGALHRVYDASVESLDRLLRRTRALILADQARHREIAGVLRDVLAKV